MPSLPYVKDHMASPAIHSRSHPADHQTNSQPLHIAIPISHSDIQVKSTHDERSHGVEQGRVAGRDALAKEPMPTANCCAIWASFPSNRSLIPRPPQPYWPNSGAGESDGAEAEQYAALPERRLDGLHKPARREQAHTQPDQSKMLAKQNVEAFICSGGPAQPTFTGLYRLSNYRLRELRI